jgi:hypothetical protein
MFFLRMLLTVVEYAGWIFSRGLPGVVCKEVGRWFCVCAAAATCKLLARCDGRRSSCHSVTCSHLAGSGSFRVLLGESAPCLRLGFFLRFSLVGSVD